MEIHAARLGRAADDAMAGAMVVIIASGSFKIYDRR